MTRVRVSLGEKLKVRTHYRALPATVHQEFSWELVFSHTLPYRSWWIHYETLPGHDRGELDLWGPESERRCGSVSIDRTAATATLTLTPRCVRDAAWVRVETSTQTREGERWYWDEGLRLSPEIHRNFLLD